MDQKQLEKLEKFCVANGMKGFVIGTKANGILSLRFQNMGIADAQEVMISGFLQVITMELEHHPEYSAEYKKLYLDLMADFKSLIKTSNGKFQSFHKKHGNTIVGIKTK